MTVKVSHVSTNPVQQQLSTSFSKHNQTMYPNNCPLRPSTRFIHNWPCYYPTEHSPTARARLICAYLMPQRYWNMGHSLRNEERAAFRLEARGALMPSKSAHVIQATKLWHKVPTQKDVYGDVTAAAKLISPIVFPKWHLFNDGFNEEVIMNRWFLGYSCSPGLE